VAKATERRVKLNIVPVVPAWANRWRKGRSTVLSLCPA